MLLSHWLSLNPPRCTTPIKKSASPSKHVELLLVVYIPFPMFSNTYYRNISNVLPSAKLRDISNNFVLSICFKFQLETIGNGTIRTYDMYTYTYIYIYICIMGKNSKMLRWRSAFLIGVRLIGHCDKSTSGLLSTRL